VINAARWRGGRCCNAATNARRTVSRDSATLAGSSGSSRPSGIGSIHVTSGRISPIGPLGERASPRSIGRARRSRPLSMSRHTFVAIRYSHERSAARPSKRSSARHARSSVSWTASSASNGEPSIR